MYISRGKVVGYGTASFPDWIWMNCYSMVLAYRYQMSETALHLSEKSEPQWNLNSNAIAKIPSHLDFWCTDHLNGAVTKNKQSLINRLIKMSYGGKLEFVEQLLMFE